MVHFSLAVGLAGLAYLQAAWTAPTEQRPKKYCPVYFTKPPAECLQAPETFLPFLSNSSNAFTAEAGILENAAGALVVMQEHYFDSDYNTWPSAIDWTAAVAGTIVTGVLTTLSKSSASTATVMSDDWKAKENFISSFYSQVVGSYFGQDVISIRGQAYDDILWVVLGWIEAIKFVKTHSDLHYPHSRGQGKSTPNSLDDVLGSIPWHGHNWVSAFAHRARIFWNLGSAGWDTRLCGGGMTWNPRLTPYKNAITNELWISASISMYQHFPGDNFTAPWLESTAFPRKDPKHVQAALEGYGWLMNINMTNHQGLFVDGFHVDRKIPGNTRCDLRDEMVYTYNQGVILTGQRGLWGVSGDASYLRDGHSLIHSVIQATGWHLHENRPLDNLDEVHIDRLPPWRGLGRGGIIEEQCDASGTCSQDGQTFKGIFFHHLATFCTPLDSRLTDEGETLDTQAFHRVKRAHATACRSYTGWLKHNAVAALKTRDDAGRFGMWWGAGIWNRIVTRDEDGIDHEKENPTDDYRNHGTPEDKTWGEGHQWRPGKGNRGMEKQALQQLAPEQHALGQQLRQREVREEKNEGNKSYDPNARGRGRTIETQMGGLALLRAYWDISHIDL